MKNKGTKTYNKWRQGYLRRRLDMAEPMPFFHCEKQGCVCKGRVTDVLQDVDGHIGFRWNLLSVCHVRGRLSHPESKMKDDGVYLGCFKANAADSGVVYKDAKPQWSRGLTR